MRLQFVLRERHIDRIVDEKKVFKNILELGVQRCQTYLNLEVDGGYWSDRSRNVRIV